MIVNLDYSNRHFILEPYTSFQEKELLLIPTYHDVIDEKTLDVALNIVGFYKKNPVSDLSIDEKKFILSRYREMSIGNDVDINFTCEFCKEHMSNTGELISTVKEPIKHNSHVIDLHVTPNQYNKKAFYRNIDELDYDVFEEIDSHLTDYVTSFETKIDVHCLRCRKVNTFILGTKLLISLLSPESLKSMYQVYSDLIYFSHYTKQDIDGMYPFERIIFINLLKQTMENRNKSSKNFLNQ